MTDSSVCLLCLIGLPGAGKTFLASAIQKNKLGFSQVEHISFDKLISWEQNDNNLGIMWKDKRRIVFESVNQLIINFLEQKSVSGKLLIILDDNMYYRSMRHEFFRLAKKYDSKYCQIYLDIPLAVCCERNNLREASIPTNHIINMNEKLEIPISNSHWEKYSLTITQDFELNDSLEAIKKFISESKLITKTNLLPERSEQSSKHLADIALRKLISQSVKQIKNSTKDVSLKINELIEKRQAILNSIDNGNLQLPRLSTVDDYINHFIPIFQKSG